jgi:CHASE2 domain-containing sensor protein
MAINIKQNAANWGIDIVWIIQWVGGWGILEILVTYLTKQREDLRFLIYIFLFFSASVIFLMVGQNYPEIND